MSKQPLTLPRATMWAAVITGVLGCVGGIIAAVVTLGQPFVQRLVEPTSVVIVVTATPPQPVDNAQPASQPTQSSLCPDTVARSMVSMWDIGATNKGNVQLYLDAYESQRKKGGGFVKGDTIPAGVIIATDFWNGESEAWQTYPVKPIVHYRSWGLFEVTRSFSAPSEGSCITIVP
jgi:hypothetical protein